jgi:hypothetical protein
MDRASRVVSTDAHATAVEQDRNSSSAACKIASDNEDVELEGSENSPRLHKLET